MKIPKSIQLPVEFFTQTYLLLWRLEEFYELDGDTRTLCSDLSELVDKKLEAMNRHDTFTKYKIAMPGSAEREALRREYLDRSYCPKDWRSTKEVHDSLESEEDIPF
jgi:LmbE family N-acetylglucosaminyl deacetylase